MRFRTATRLVTPYSRVNLKQQSEISRQNRPRVSHQNTLQLTVKLPGVIADALQLHTWKFTAPDVAYAQTVRPPAGAGYKPVSPEVRFVFPVNGTALEVLAPDAATVTTGGWPASP